MKETAMKHITINRKGPTVLAALFLTLQAGSLPAATVILTNQDFSIGVTGWDISHGNDLAQVPPTVYVEQIPNLSSPTIQIKSNSGNYFQQTLALTDIGSMDATSFGQFTVAFEYGYRRDAVTNGNHQIRVSLWNVTDGYELSGHTFTIFDPGVGTNILFEKEISLVYDNSALSLIGDSLAIRFGNASPSLGFAGYERTAVIDNITVGAIPEPSGWLLSGMAAVLLALRRNRANEFSSVGTQDGRGSESA